MGLGTCGWAMGLSVSRGCCKWGFAVGWGGGVGANMGSCTAARFRIGSLGRAWHVMGIAGQWLCSGGLGGEHEPAAWLLSLELGQPLSLPAPYSFHG